MTAWAPRYLLLLVAAAGLVAVHAPPVHAQDDDRLYRRWVGRHLGRPLFFDFFGDSMLVVNDVHALGFWHNRDSLVAYGDTSFAIRYRFSYDKMLIENIEGNTVTMSPQPIEARPIYSGLGFGWGTWRSTLGDGTPVTMQMRRIGNAARYRVSPGQWQEGEWRREARRFTFTWNAGTPDSTLWYGTFDARGHQFVFEETVEGSGVTIFRRTYR